MIVVDASALFEIAIDRPLAESVRGIFDKTTELAAPELIDAEVMGLIRRDWTLGKLHESRAEVAISELRRWPGERFSHRAFTDRVWELRHNVRTWDAYYVALAELLGAPLVTLDRRLATANGPTCEFIIP